MYKFKPGRLASMPDGPPGLKLNAPPLHPVGFSFAFVGPGDLLALPLRPLVSRCDEFPSALKIERPTAVRTVFERPGG